jgi:hypothetical protein
MQKSFPKLVWATTIALLVLYSLVAAAPVRAVCGGAVSCQGPRPPFSGPGNPVWATLNAATQGNYPGGNETFYVFVVNSDQPPNGNVTLINETLTAPALPPEYQTQVDSVSLFDEGTNSSIGLPIDLSPGEAIRNAMTLEIPSNFMQDNFTAHLVVNVAVWNGTTSTYLRLTSSTVVNLHGLPSTGSQTTTSSSTTQSTQTTQTITQGGTVSSSLFAAGVAIPTTVAVILLALLVRGRPKRGH